MPKIFFIIPFLTKGGAQRVVTNLSNYFSSKNYRVYIIILNDCEIGYALNDGIEVIHLIKGRSTGFLSRVSNTLTTFYKLVSLVNNHSPDVVISFTTSANMWAGVICTILRVPYIVSERTIPSRTLDRFNPAIKKAVHFFYRRAKSVVVPSKGIADGLLKNNELENINIIKNPVTVFKPLTNKRVHHRAFILAVGRFNFVKGFDQLIAAYEKSKCRDADLIIVGDGEERPKLQAMIDDLGLSGNVFLPGKKDNLQDYYEQCQMFVLSSRNEGYPNVLIEAMSAGCASIAFDCETGPADIIQHGVNGLLVHNGDVAMLGEAIHLLAKDEDLRRRLGNEGKLIGDANSMEEVASEWEELISQSV